MASVRSAQRKRFSQYGWLAVLLLVAITTCVADAQHVHDKSPINYSKTQPDNCVTRLQTRIDSGEAVLKHDERLGYLPAVLDALEVPVSSQALVFSKTSLQVTKISPQRPRAIYFGDDVYIGWVQKSNMMEISAVDPKLGAVFYTIKHTPAERPQFTRGGSVCLACHATRHTDYVPGHVVFSVYSDALGSPIARAGFSATDHTSPFRGRWGGWYVSGKHGDQRHRGNSTMRYLDRPEDFDFDKGANRTDLSELFDVKPYPAPHSDLIALMVLEHQTLVHNRITAANYHGRIAAEDAGVKQGGKDRTEPDAAQRRLDNAVQQLVEALLLAREAPLHEPIRGTSDFAKEFSALGRRDSQGRSLRDLDLQHRLFRYPCSYLIYSEAFDGLPKPVRHQVYEQLWQVLTADEPPYKYRHVTTDDRRAIVEILRETKTEVAEVWPTEE